MQFEQNPSCKAEQQIEMSDINQFVLPSNVSSNLLSPPAESSPSLLFSLPTLLTSSHSAHSPHSSSLFMQECPAHCHNEKCQQQFEQHLRSRASDSKPV